MFFGGAFRPLRFPKCFNKVALFSGLMERGVFTGVRLTVQHTLHHSVKKFTKYKSDVELFVCLLTDSRLRSRYDVRYIR